MTFKQAKGGGRSDRKDHRVLLFHVCVCCAHFVAAAWSYQRLHTGGAAGGPVFYCPGDAALPASRRGKDAGMIRIDHAVKTYKDGKQAVHALRDVSLRVEKGDIYGIVGFSGAGKSTLLRLVNGLERRTAAPSPWRGRT